jgi:putative ABC transport system permease protein
MILQSFTMAFKAVLSNKMRSALTILGIVIGVVAVVLLIGVGQGTTSAVTSNLESMGTNLLTANIRGYRASSLSVTMDELTALEGQDGIDRICPVITQSVTAKVGSSTYDTSLIATTIGYDDVRNTHISSGRFLRQPDLDNLTPVAVVGTEVADELFGHRDVVGETISMNGRAFTIVGVLEEKGSSSAGSSDNQVIIPYTLGEKMYYQRGISTFYASAQSAETVTQAQASLNAFLLAKFNNDSDAFSLFNQTEMLDSLSETSQTLSLMLGGIAGISLLVGGIGIMNIMLVSVSERTREIGIRKAVGAGRGDILLQFLIEALVISGIGGAIGLLIAYGARGILQNLLSMSMVLSPSVMGMAIGFSIFIGVVFGLYPANKASKLRPIEALRYDG